MEDLTAHSSSQGREVNRETGEEEIDNDQIAEISSPISLPKRPLPEILTNHPSSHKASIRGRQALTPEQYVKSIKAHSSRSITNSSFPGNNYIDLATWLSQNSGPFRSLSTQPHLLAMIYELGGQGPEKPSVFTQDQLDALTVAPRSPKDQGQILFVRGYMSPAWILTLGSKYGIDPEFLLDFFASTTHRRLYSLPSLASTTNNIMQLCVSTILYRDTHSGSWDHGRDMLSHWSYEVEELSTYKRQLRTIARCGDSLIREYSTLDDHYSIIEQRISVALVRNGDGWLGFVWMDQGRDLALSPGGPWTAHLHAKASAFPVIQHHPKMTARNTYNNSGRITPSDPDAPPQPRLRQIPSTKPVPQSGSLLPLEYDSLLALVDLRRRCASDPYLALAPIFVHAAFSEAQVLNLMENQIDREVNILAPGTQQGSLEKLQYLSNILDRHTAQLKQAVRAIEMLFEAHCSASEGQPVQRHRWKERHGSAGTLSSITDDRDNRHHADLVVESFLGLSSGSFTAKGLLDDYRDLLTRSSNLCGRCKTGIEIMMNKAMVQESRKAIEQNERLKKLTLLATFFIPLSFSASLFGMNLKVFGQGKLGLWWFFVISVPITSVAYFFYSWNVRKWKEVLKGWMKRS